MKIYNITAAKKLLAAIEEAMPEFRDLPDIFISCGVLCGKLRNLVVAAKKLDSLLDKDLLKLEGIDFSKPIAPENVAKPEKPEAEQPKADLHAELMAHIYGALCSTIQKLCGSPMRTNEICQSLRVLSEVLRALGQMDGQETSR